MHVYKFIWNNECSQNTITYFDSRVLHLPSILNRRIKLHDIVRNVEHQLKIIDITFHQQSFEISCEISCETTNVCFEQLFDICLNYIEP